MSEVPPLLALSRRIALPVGASAPPAADVEAIEKDLLRAGRKELGVSDADAEAHRAALRRCLLAWCVLRPDVGYVQSMAAIMATLLVGCDHDEQAASSLFAQLLARLPADYYSAALHGARCEAEALVRLHAAQCSGVTMSDAVDEAVLLVGQRWLLSLWAGVLSPACSLELWRRLLCEPACSSASEPPTGVEMDAPSSLSLRCALACCCLSFSAVPYPR